MKREYLVTREDTGKTEKLWRGGVLGKQVLFTEEEVKIECETLSKILSTTVTYKVKIL